MTEAKTPQPGEWWQHDDGSGPNHRIYVIGKNSCGEILLEAVDSNLEKISDHGWHNWHHLPDCTGFDWEPEKPIDPGEGWRLLEDHEVVLATDERSYSNIVVRIWIAVGKSMPQRVGKTVAECRAIVINVIFRRRVEAFPQWIIPKLPNKFVYGGYVLRASKEQSTHFLAGGESLELQWDHIRDELVADGTWIVVSQAEAEATIPSKQPAAGVDSKSDYRMLFVGETIEGSDEIFVACWQIVVPSLVGRVLREHDESKFRRKVTATPLQLGAKK